MNPRSLLAAFLAAGLLVLPPAQADEMPAEGLPEDLVAVLSAALLPLPSATAAEKPVDRRQEIISRALGLIGIKYKMGGASEETGFDCSGFVGHVFREVMGLVLPRSSYDMVNTGEPVEKSALKPGDLVFFHTMQRAFSHVGIYIGDNKFVHAPRTGKKIRVEDMRGSYWAKRYNGARRLEQ